MVLVRGVHRRSQLLDFSFLSFSGRRRQKAGFAHTRTHTAVHVEFSDFEGSLATMPGLLGGDVSGHIAAMDSLGEDVELHPTSLA